jgi:hypothetical protein
MNSNDPFARFVEAIERWSDIIEPDDLDRLVNATEKVGKAMGEDEEEIKKLQAIKKESKYGER